MAIHRACLGIGGHPRATTTCAPAPGDGEPGTRTPGEATTGRWPSGRPTSRSRPTARARAAARDSCRRGRGPVPTRHVAGRAHADRQARGAPVPAPPGPAAPRRPGRCRVAGDCLAALSAAESAEVAYDGPGAGPRPGERLRARAQAARRGCLGPRAGQPGVPQEGRDVSAPRDPRARAGLLGKAPRTSQGAGLPRPDAPRGQHRHGRRDGAVKVRLFGPSRFLVGSTEGRLGKT